MSTSDQSPIHVSAPNGGVGTVVIDNADMAGPITLRPGTYLGHEFMELPEGMVLRVPNARHNGGHRFSVRVFESPTGLHQWVSDCTARRIIARFPDAVGTLSALPSIISRHPANDTPVQIQVQVGRDILRTSVGDFRVVEVTGHDPFLVPA